MSSNDWCGTPKADMLYCELNKLLKEHNAHDILGEVFVLMSMHRGEDCGHEHPDTISIIANGIAYKACPCGAHWRE